MPLPQSKNVGKLISSLKRKGEKKRPHKQIVAIALKEARKSGAKVSSKGQFTKSKHSRILKKYSK